MAFWRKAIVGVLAFAAVFVWYAVFDGSAEYLEVSFLDVGQGDAIFVETPEGAQILIDGGSGRRVLSELSRVMPGYDKSIDMLIATHTDYDHLAGLVEVLKRYEVNTVIENGYTANTAIFGEWQELTKAQGINRETVKVGDRISLDSGIYIDILGPYQTDFEENLSKANEVMITARLVFGEAELLLTGDLERGDELRLANSGINLSSDVLKVAHHGSKNATTDLFLQRVAPDIAVVSVGVSNRYGHPNVETVERLKNAGASLYRTDTDGRIVLRSNGVMFSKVETGL